MICFIVKELFIPFLRYYRVQNEINAVCLNPYKK